MAHGLWLALIVLVVLVVAAETGMTTQSWLREGHRTTQTADHVRLVASILVTITALVLSLLLSEVKGSFDSFDSRLGAFAADLSNLDVHLREYGDEAKPIRAVLRQYVAGFLADTWRGEAAPAGDLPEVRAADRRRAQGAWRAAHQDG